MTRETEIEKQDFIFLDFQTTGTVAKTSDVIEAGWGLFRAVHAPDHNAWTTRLVSLSDDRQLSRTIQRLTGLSADYYKEQESIVPAHLQSELRQFLETHEKSPIVIHYAQFKLPFLWKVLEAEEGEGRDSLLKRVICVHRLARVLIPELKSFSLRAVAGYAGYATAEKKRSIDHLIATAYVWRYLAERLKEQDPPDDLLPWLKTIKPGEAKALPIHDPILRKKRLALPGLPGVYFFIDKFENILYVGKAASLKHRVNSYFRGRKTKGSRLNEMLTRAVDFRYVIVGSELEALIRENDEIKRHDPPYNRLLRVEGRTVQFLRFNDYLAEPVSWGYRTWGPMSSLWMMEALKPFMETADVAALIPSFMTGIGEEIIALAVQQLFAHFEMELIGSPSPENWYQLALRVWSLEYARLLHVPADESADEEPGVETAAAQEEEDEEDDEEEDWTVEDVESYLSDAFRHLLRQMYRSRWFLRLCHCRIEWRFVDDLEKTHNFQFVRGELVKDVSPIEALSYNERNAVFDRLVYDRIGIIYSALKRGVRRGDKVKLYLSDRHVYDEVFLQHVLRC